jgi:hypothetical protein
MHRSADGQVILLVPQTLFMDEEFIRAVELNMT